MNKILKFSEYYDWQEIAQEFLSNLNQVNINESDVESHFTDMIKSIFNKFNFNISLVLTFGTGVKLMYPIISKLIDNMQLEIKPSQEDIVLLCITMIAIMYLENKKTPPISAEDIKHKLNAEIQMKFGNPRILVGKLLKCFESIFLFIKKFPKLFGVAVDNIVDMFAYTSILQPVMNIISSLVGEYHITPENLKGNLLSLGTGVATITGKTFLDYIKNKKDKKSGDHELSDLEDLGKIDKDGNKLIKEQ
jgi:hypothetical protein